MQRARRAMLASRRWSAAWAQCPRRSCECAWLMATAVAVRGARGGGHSACVAAYVALRACNPQPRCRYAPAKTLASSCRLCEAHARCHCTLTGTGWTTRIAKRSCRRIAQSITWHLVKRGRARLAKQHQAPACRRVRRSSACTASSTDPKVSAGSLQARERIVGSEAAA